MTGQTDLILDTTVSGYFSASSDDWTMLESYYLGLQPPRMLTMRQRESLNFKRFFTVINVCGVIVNEPTGYLVNAEVKIKVPGENNPFASVKAVSMAASSGQAQDTTEDTLSAQRGQSEPNTGQVSSASAALMNAPQLSTALPSETVLSRPPGALTEAPPGKGTSSLSPLAQWALAFIKQRVKGKITDLLVSMGVFGEGYLYAYVDNDGLSRGIKVRALAPMELGSERVKVQLSSDEEEVQRAALTWKEQSSLMNEIVTKRVTITPQTILVEERGRRQDGRITDWTTLSQEDNSYGVTPVVRVRNPVASDLTPIIPMQDDLNKSGFDIRVTREYHGFPMLTTANAGETAHVEIGPGKVLAGGPWSRLEAGDLTSLIQSDKETMGRIAMLSASLILQEKGSEAPSGLALSYLQQSFVHKVRGKADALEQAYMQLLRLVSRMLYTSPDLYDLEQPMDDQGNIIPREAFINPIFLVEILPETLQNMAAQMAADTQAVAAKAMTVEEFSRRNGIDPAAAIAEFNEADQRATALAIKLQNSAPPSSAPDQQT